ncbi:Receptor-like protein [Arachis hypogaea]|nr:Receptor-like protein [Arachis hypogaea]
MLFHFFACLSSHHSCHSEESSALLHFINTELSNDTYSSYEDDCSHVYPKTSTWKNGTDCCSWMGVTCHSVSGHVIGLDLSCSTLEGKIHPNTTLFHLTHLQTLNLALNNISGPELPSQFGRFVSLTHLNLSACDFKGDIPSQISHLSKLQSLDLSWNDALIWKEITWKRMLQNATDLREIVLDGADMSSITTTFSNWSFSLVTLSLVDTGIRGHLTSHILCLPNLHELYLSNIQVHVPKSNCSTSLSILDLSWCQFTRSQIPPSFSNLTHLTSLDLSLSNLDGSFPSLFSNLQYLTYLDLSHNAFSGPITSLLTNLQHVTYLDLSYNEFSGSIPSFLANLQHLTHLDLSFNAFSGPVPNFLDSQLSHNKFRGTIPQCLANSSNLKVLDLQMNKLHGTLPSTFPRNLISLNLNGNQLEGHLPRSLSNCKHLMDLNLGNNQIEDTFPNWLQRLQNLRILVLQSNKLYGPIVSLKTKDAFSHLLVFDISSNNFSGQLPKSYIKSFQAMKGVFGAEVQSSFDYFETSSYGGIYWINFQNYEDSLSETIKGVRLDFEKIPTILAVIDFSGNKFEGEIPDVIGKLHILKGLNLSHNRLVGHIPHSLGNLTKLESLDLSSNMLAGNIPTELTNLNFLEVLNLSQNQLVGPIPRGKQFDTFSKDSYQGNMGLCGLPLSIQCNNNVPLQQDPPSEAEDKFGFGWKPVAIGYAFGMMLGIGLGYCVFSIGKPQWLVILFGGKRIKRRSRGNRRARTTLFQLFVVM